MIEYCLFLPVGYFFYYMFYEEENNGERDDEGRRYGKELENCKKKD
jgi:hypothetical protein